MMLPQWAQVVLGAAAVVGALGVLWTKIFRPVLRFGAAAEKMLPLLRIWTEQFANSPGSAAVLDEIVRQVRTDSGSSLLDIVRRLDVAAQENRTAAEILKIGVESARQLAEQDRSRARRLEVLIDRLAVRVETGTAGVQRIESDRAEVAVDLAADRESDRLGRADIAGHLAADRESDREGRAEVAGELAADRRRADDAAGPPGAAADAASQSPGTVDPEGKP